MGWSKGEKVVKDGSREEYSPAEIASVPRRPIQGSSTAQPARKAPGIPVMERMTCCYKCNDT